MIEFTAQSPPEPAPGSVVLDLDGVAWQRFHDAESVWCPARPQPPVALNTPCRSWPVLLIEKRTLRLIYDAELTVQMPDLVPRRRGEV